jgi:hypothetical protein
MPTSSGAHVRALQTVPGMSAQEQPHPAAASLARSEPPRTASYASAVGDSLPIPGAETEYGSRHDPGLHPSMPHHAPTRAASAAPTGEFIQMQPAPVSAVSEDASEGGWAVYNHTLYTEIQVLRSEVAASREEEGRLREEILELRTLIAVLDAVVTLHAADNAPSGEEGVRGSRKTKTSPWGDVPNRRKTSHDPEYSSTSGEEASDEDADEAPTRAPLGRRVSGLKEQTTRQPEFETLVSYRTYRLSDTTRVVDLEDTGRVNGYLKKLKHYLDNKISGDPAIQVLYFLSTFKEAADLNRIREGTAVLILPYFLEGRVKSGLSSWLKQAAASLPKFPVALQWLLQACATKAVISAACQKVFSAKQIPEEDEKTYANRLTRNAAEAGSVFTEDACSDVKSHLGSHLLTPVTRLYTQHTNRHPEVASSDTKGEGDGCKGKLDL